MRLSSLLTMMGSCCLGAAGALASDLAWFPAERSIGVRLDFSPPESVQTPPVADSSVGPPAGAWSDSAAAMDSHPSGLGWLDGACGQFSSVLATGLDCDLFAELEFSTYAQVDVAISSVSSFESYFAVTSSTELTLEGDLSASCFAEFQPVIPSAYSAFASIEIRRVGGDELFSDMAYVEFFINQATGELITMSTPLAWTQIISAGVYQVVVRAIAQNSDGIDRAFANEPARLNAAV